MTGQLTLASEYERMSADRAPFLDRARENALVTVPELYPPEGSHGQDRYLPWQSMGAYGTNNLSSKWMLALFPPHRPFFRLQPEATAEEQLDEETQALIDSALGKAERRVFDEINHMRLRPVAYRALRHLIVGGNFLIRIHQGKASGYTLDQYVVSRAYNGDLRRVIIREEVPWSALSSEIREAATPAPLFTGMIDSQTDLTGTGPKDGDSVFVFTCFYEENKTWKSFQEINGILVPGSEASYGKGKRPPILALRWFGQDGEDYGRAFVDDYYGDLSAVEDLSKNLIKFAGIASKVVFTKDPAGITDVREVRDAETGETVTGDADEFKTINLKDKVFDFQAASTRLQEIEARLKLSFLLNTSVQRNAERVTAEEIRQLMGELETAHAGTLSNFSDEFQLPLVELVMADMTRRRLLPELKKTRAAITTGVDALSRNQELADLTEAISTAIAVVGPEEFWAKHDPDEVSRRILVSKGVKLEGLERSKQEAQQYRQQRAAAPLLEKAAGPAAGAIARSAQQGNTEQ